jgi:hypothetical protein
VQRLQKTAGVNTHGLCLSGARPPKEQICKVSLQTSYNAVAQFLGNTSKSQEVFLVVFHVFDNNKNQMLWQPFSFHIYPHSGRHFSTHPEKKSWKRSPSQRKRM